MTLQLFLAHLPVFSLRVLWFLSCLSIIIILHELSHFIACLIVKCKVEVVSLGFGKPIFKRTIKDTCYQISPFLVGGYCQLKEELNLSTDTDAFTALPYRKKLVISLAGCFINIVTGVIALYIGWKYIQYHLLYFAILSLSLGISNLFPLLPCLDGGYIFYIPILTRLYGKEKGLRYFETLCTVSLRIVLVLNILCIPYLLYLIWVGVL